MSNDVRGLLHDAATVPATDADVAGAWRRGRRLRAQRRALSGLAVVAVIALGSIGVANLVPSGHDAKPASPPTTISATCAAPITAAVPSWADSADVPSAIPHLVSPDGNVVAILFGNPLRAGTPTDRANKILWIVRQPRDGQALEITATLPGSREKPVHITKAADSSPGEIYPSIDDVPAPGCWHFGLAWNGHRSAINLDYAPGETTSATTVPVTSTNTPTTAVATLTPCRTVNLDITLTGPIGSAGHFNYDIAFRNTGASTCIMTGFPGVSFLDASSHQIGAPAGRNPISSAPVTVAPGATAYAHLSVTDPSVLGGCAATPVATLRIFPPNERAQALVGADGIAVCAQQTPSSTIDPVLDHRLG